MKEKILNALKSSVKNTTISDKTFDAYATLIASTVTEESQIQDAVSKFAPVIEITQGDINHQLASAVKAKTDTKADVKNDAFDPEKLSSLLQEAINKAVTPLQEKITSFETNSKHANMKADVKQKLMKEYNLNEKVCDLTLSKIKIDRTSTSDELFKTALADVNETLIATVGTPAQPTVIPNTNVATNPFESFKTELQNKGVIPK